MPNRRQISLGMLAALSAPAILGSRAGGAAAQPLADGALADRLAQLVAAAVPPGRGGLIAGVARRGELVAFAAAGSANIESGAPIGPDTSFHIASSSKHVVAMAIGLLAGEGRIGLDEPVRRYPPRLADYGTPITVRQLIHHTSGLREQWTLLSLAGWREGDRHVQGDVVEMIYRQTGLEAPPGTVHAYNNSGYTLQAELVEAVSGMTLRAFSRQRLFGPLGMGRSYWRDDVEEVVPGRAASYDVGGGGRLRFLPLNFATTGATGLNTTLADFARWDRAFYPGSIFPERLLALAAEPGRLSNGTPAGYGFGVQVGDRGGHRLISHSGADAGFRSLFMRFPDLGATVLLLANDCGLNFMRLGQAIADTIIQGPEPDLARLRPTVPGALAPEARRVLLGRYRAADGTTLDLVATGPEDAVAMIGSSVIPFVPLSETEGLLAIAELPIAFRREAGKVAGHTLQGRDFARLPAPTSSDPARLAGRYWSPDLMASLTLSVQGGALVCTLAKGPSAVLMPIEDGLYAGIDGAFLEARADGSLAVNGHGATGIRFTRVG